MTMTNYTTSKKMTDAEIEEQAGINYDLINELQERLEQVSAMLTITCGHETFGNWRNDIQDKYLWACAVMLDQAKAMANKLDLRTEQ